MIVDPSASNFRHRLCCLPAFAMALLDKVQGDENLYIGGYVPQLALTQPRGVVIVSLFDVAHVNLIRFVMLIRC
jgi:hypothetical protein